MEQDLATRLNLGEYEPTRAYLLTNTAGVRRIIHLFKKRHKLNGLSINQQKDKILISRIYRNELQNDLQELASFLDLTTLVLISIISGDKDFLLSVPIYESSEIPKENDYNRGWYIKVDPTLQENTLLGAYYYILSVWGKLGVKVPQWNRKDNLQERVQIYCRIEESHYEFLKTLDDEYSNKEQKGDSRKTPINDSIEEVANKLNKKKGNIKANYYSLKRKYYIPSSLEQKRFEKKLLQFMPTD